MRTLILNCCYLVLTILVLPMVAWKRFRIGKYKHGWGQKLLGNVPARMDLKQPCLWLHAVSVGEVLQLRPIVDRLQRVDPQAKIVISTTTETGHAVAREKFPHCEVIFFPLDYSWSVQRALQRIQPDLIVLVELELWPNFIFAAAKRRIPLALINGRLSERSFRGYGRIRPLVQQLLQCFSLIGTQTEEYRQRFLHLGASPGTTLVTGSIKFDGVATNPDQPLTRELADWLQLTSQAPVFVAGSTQAPEESLAINVFAALRKNFPRLRLVIVPRHPERGGEIAQLIRQQGFIPLQRTCRAKTGIDQQRLENREEEGKGEDDSSNCIGLLDTVGELGACWGLANIAFVGGSFTNRGGQNMLEPAAYGAAVCFGPKTWNFKQIVELLLAANAARRVQSPQELEQFVCEMLTAPALARSMGTRAKELVLSQQGATDRTVDALLPLLAASPAGYRHRAA